MPYLEQGVRASLDEGRKALKPGELNYQFSQLIRSYIAMKNGLSYTTINDIIGALECQKLELYRRLAGPYEDKKAFENGDAY
jgi:hypothetical protein